jgi:polyhydroxyalkanoate synthesis regulator phasin
MADHANTSGFGNNCGFHCIISSLLALPDDQIAKIIANKKYAANFELLRQNFIKYYNITKKDMSLMDLIKFTRIMCIQDQQVMWGPVLRNVAIKIAINSLTNDNNEYIVFLKKKGITKEMLSPSYLMDETHLSPSMSDIINARENIQEEEARLRKALSGTNFTETTHLQLMAENFGASFKAYNQQGEKQHKDPVKKGLWSIEVHNTGAHWEFNLPTARQIKDHNRGFSKEQTLPDDRDELRDTVQASIQSFLKPIVEHHAPSVPKPTSLLTTTKGSKIPTKPNQSINPYKVSYKGRTAKQQADQIMADFKRILAQNPKAKIAITYSANNDQALDIINGYKTGEYSVNGSNQAAVFHLVIEQIKRDSLQDQIHILPISTCEHAGGTGTLTQTHIDRDKQNIAKHIGAGWIVLGLQNEDTQKDEYAIGGGVVRGWKSTLLGHDMITAMQQMTRGDFSGSLLTAFTAGQTNPDELLMTQEVDEISERSSPLLKHFSEKRSEQSSLLATRLATASSRLDPMSTGSSQAEAAISLATPKQWHKFTEIIQDIYSSSNVSVIHDDNLLHIVDKSKNVDVSVIRSDSGNVKIKSTNCENTEDVAIFCDLIKEAAKITNNRQVNITSGTTEQIIQLYEKLRKDTIPYNMIISPSILEQMTKEALEKPNIDTFLREYNALKKDSIVIPSSTPLTHMQKHAREQESSLLGSTKVSSTIKTIDELTTQATRLQKEYDKASPEKRSLDTSINELNKIKRKLNEQHTITEEQRERIQVLSQEIKKLDKASPQPPHDTIPN